MARQPDTLRGEAVLLRDDSMGVATENTPRKLQERSTQTGFRCSLNVEWLDQLGIAADKEPTLHSVSMGLKPVIVQKPAIIVQPADAINEDY